MRVSCYFLLLVATSLACGVSTASESISERAAREAAVELARGGNFDEALGGLGALRDVDPLNPLSLHDETVVLGWAGRDLEAFENSRLIEFRTAPDFVINAVARAARNIGEFDDAVRWYGMLLDRDVGNLDARRGLAQTHADAGSFDRGWSTIEKAPEEQRNDVALILTQAYLYEREQRFLEALASYQRVAEMQPDNRAALRGEALMLRAVLMPRQALALAREYPDILSSAEILHLEADVAAVQVRHAAQSYYPASRRHEGTDSALAKVNALLERDDLDPMTRSRLRYDRIVALTNRLHMSAAIEEFETLNEDVSTVPAYALAAAGRAYLSERQPETARDLLELALRKQPDNFHIKFQLFFAYADLQNANRAMGLAEELMATLPEVNRLPGSRVVKGNEHYLRAAIMFGLARAYFDQLDQSQEYFENLLSRIPHNTDIRHELANVYRWRGWLDRSLSEYGQVLAVEPELMAARVGQAHARLDNRDYATVERELQSLGEFYADEPMVKKLVDRWQLHNSQELVTDIQTGESSGSTFGNEQYNVDVSWYSKPLARRYRVIAFTHDAYADFTEGEEHRKRIGAGVELRHRRWLATARLSAPRDGGALGLRGAANYRFSDSWNFGALVETESDATPLRGQRVGVSSDLVGVSAAYARNESANVRAQLRYQDFSDENSGFSFLLLAQQKLFGGPRVRLVLNGEAGIDNHKLDNVSYFSPKRSQTLAAGLRLDWMMMRRYDFGLTHTLSGMTGRYDQSGFEADDIWSFSYRFQADLNDRLNMNIGISRRSNVYDGSREYATFVLGGVQWKF